MILKGVKYLSPSGKFATGDIVVNGQTIAAVSDNDIRLNEAGTVLNTMDCFVILGLIDIYFDGAMGYDASRPHPRNPAG
jgi:dihydroorotase-like cyclic amidohydrolase